MLTFAILAVVFAFFLIAVVVFARGLLTFCPLTWMYAGEIGEGLAKVGKALFTGLVTAVFGRSE